MEGQVGVPKTTNLRHSFTVLLPMNKYPIMFMEDNKTIQPSALKVGIKTAVSIGKTGIPLQVAKVPF